MFFEINLLSPQHKGTLATVWIAATLGVKKLTKKQIMEAKIDQICDIIKGMLISQSNKPQERLSLRLAIKVINGTIRVFQRKVILLQDSLYEYLTCILRPLVVGEPEPSGIVQVKGKKKKRAVLSAEVSRPQDILQPLAIPELPQITDADLERSLREIPIAPEELITLREEMPARIPVDDEEFGFGDGAAIEMQSYVLKHILPDTEEEREAFATPMAKDADDAPPVLALETPPAEVPPTEIASAKVLPVEEERPRPKRRRTEEIEREVPEILLIPPLEQQVPSTEIETRPKRARRTTVAEAERIREATTEDVPVITPSVPRQRRRIINYKKIMVKRRVRKGRKILRCREDDYEFHEPPQYEKIQFELELFETLLEDKDFLLVFEMVIEPVAEISIDIPRESEYALSRTTSVDALTRISRGTPVPSQIVEQTPTLREEPTVSEQPSLAPGQVEVQPMPDTIVSQREVIHEPQLEIVIEEIPPATELLQIDEPLIQPAQEQPVVKEPIIASVQEKQKETSISKRQRKLIRIVDNWNYDLRDLTIEDVANKPLNRLNIAVAFSDLLYLKKLQFVNLRRKHTSIELEAIEKGAKLLK